MRDGASHLSQRATHLVAHHAVPAVQVVKVAREAVNEEAAAAARGCALHSLAQQVHRHLHRHDLACSSNSGNNGSSNSGSSNASSSSRALGVRHARLLRASE